MLNSASNIKIFDVLDSTNSYFKRIPEKKHGDVCIAITQTGGRGRGDKPFLSFGEGLYMSVLLRPEFEINSDTSVRFTCSAAVAVCESIRKITGLDAKIKWVNDIYIGEKKVCGILTELFYEGNEAYVIVGIGVNLVSHKAPDTIENIASSLYRFGETDIPSNLRMVLANDILNRLNGLYKKIPTKDFSILDSYRDMSMLEGRKINIIRGSDAVSAEAVRICDDFSLEVRYQNGNTERLYSGEVSLKLK